MRALRASLVAAIVALAAMVALPAAAQAPTKCTGKFVNPITDVCWSCLFPMSVGGLNIWPSGRPDTPNPGLPVCACARRCRVSASRPGSGSSVRLAERLDQTMVLREPGRCEDLSRFRHRQR
ncbi:TraU family protein [Sphingomonas panni]